MIDNGNNKIRKNYKHVCAFEQLLKNGMDKNRLALLIEKIESHKSICEHEKVSLYNSYSYCKIKNDVFCRDPAMGDCPLGKPSDPNWKLRFDNIIFDGIRGSFIKNPPAGFPEQVTTPHEAIIQTTLGGF